MPILEQSENYCFVLSGSHSMGTKHWLVSKISLPAGWGRTSYLSHGQVEGLIHSTSQHFVLIWIFHFTKKSKGVPENGAQKIFMLFAYIFSSDLFRLKFSRWISSLLNIVTLCAITQPLGPFTFIYIPEICHFTMHQSGSWSKRLWSQCVTSTFYAAKYHDVWKAR